ncbi:hypothetical protein ACTACG_02230 [Pseudomonas syringae]|uniref:hypothetical protein n=1 Tax=Pseudomonas syringae TaxID=317 RepID=UPI0004005287|nr:hypothetical protein [Pseudomonas syringae]KTB84742.1 hypothetical protein AO070_01010 [Pseudomonas syringae pv. syringae PD2766]
MSRKNFYRDSYLKTGWLPMQPLTRTLAIGDVCQVHQGRFQPLLNIVEAQLVERVAVSRALEFDPVEWRLSRDVQQTFCETLWAEDEEGEHRAYTKQVLEFAHSGSFVFSAGAVQAQLLTNWHAIRDDVTLKLTQLHYSFREVYVITGVVQASDWSLAVASQSGARLDMSAAMAGGDCHALLSHGSARVQQSQGIADYEQSRGQVAYFFKARKLILSDATHDHYLTRLLDNPARLPASELAHWLNAPLLNLVKANELNLNTSIDFFAWADLSLDDVERLSG